MVPTVTLLRSAEVKTNVRSAGAGTTCTTSETTHAPPCTQSCASVSATAALAQRMSASAPRDLARISHTLSATDADCGSSASLRSFGLLDVDSTTPSSPSRRAPRIRATLCVLATRRCEKCGLVTLRNRSTAVRYAYRNQLPAVPERLGPHPPWKDRGWILLLLRTEACIAFAGVARGTAKRVIARFGCAQRGAADYISADGPVVGRRHDAVLAGKYRRCCGGQQNENESVAAHIHTSIQEVTCRGDFPSRHLKLLVPAPPRGPRTTTSQRRSSLARSGSRRPRAPSSAPRASRRRWRGRCGAWRRG